MLMSMVVTEAIGYRGNDRKGGNKLEFIDMRRAYFHARARRLVYMKLPDEDNEEGKCGRLIKAMYGARDAAQNWECEYVDFMEGIGFRRGQSTPCISGMRRRELGRSFMTTTSLCSAMRWHWIGFVRESERNLRSSSGAGWAQAMVTTRR